MADYTLTDGSVVVSLNPQWDLKFDSRKNQIDHRTRSGAAYHYKWGDYGHVSFSIEDLSSSDMCAVNSWWGANTPVVLYDTTTTAVISGTLVNASAPIDSYVEPYIDLFKGTIELETF